MIGDSISWKRYEDQVSYPVTHTDLVTNESEADGGSSNNALPRVYCARTHPNSTGRDAPSGDEKRIVDVRRLRVGSRLSRKDRVEEMGAHWWLSISGNRSIADGLPGRHGV